MCITGEVPFEIPDSWEWIRLGSFISLTSSQDMTPDKYNSSHSGIPYITGASNIDNDEVIINRWTDSPKAIAYEGDLLLTCKGTVGTMAFLKEKQVHIARQVMAISSPFGVNLRFVRLYLDSYVTALKTAAKSMIPGISRTDVLKILFPLPPENEQIRILQKHDDLVQPIIDYNNAEQRTKELNDNFPEKLKKSILQWAVQGKLVPQDPSDEPASILLEHIREEKDKLIKEGEIKKDKNESTIFRRDNSHYEKLNGKDTCIDDEIPFDVPASWMWCRLRDIMNIVSARRVHQSDWKTSGVPFFRAREIGKLAEYGSVDNELFISEELYENFSQNGIPHVNDLMVTAVGALGKTYVVKDTDRFYYKDASVLCFENFSGINPHYIKLLLSSPFMEEQIKDNSSGTTVGTITIIKAANYLIPIPPLKEQSRIVSMYDILQNSINRI